jgi:O-methyltransferase
MLFDDYGFDSCPGARKAVDEFFANKPEKPFYLPSEQRFVVCEG